MKSKATRRRLGTTVSQSFRHRGNGISGDTLISTFIGLRLVGRGGGWPWGVAVRWAVGCQTTQLWEAAVEAPGLVRRKRWGAAKFWVVAKYPAQM